MSIEEFTRVTLAMTDEEWFAHDLTPPCERGTKRCVASHRSSDECRLIGPPRLAPNPSRVRS